MSLTDNNEDQLYDREFWHRINQANAPAGAPPVMPDQWAEITAMADQMSNALCLELPYDRNLVAQRIAGHMVKEHIKAWDAVGHRSVDERWCPESEATLYALNYSGIPAWITALRSIEQLRGIKEDLLTGGGYFRCNARVNRHCDLTVSGMNATYPVEPLAVKRGEYICVFIACRACLEHIHTGAGFNDDYIGPDQDWVDDREAQPVGREYDPWSNPDGDDDNMGWNS
jgi:hypothetical protein